MIVTGTQAMHNLHYWMCRSQTTFRKQIAVLREVIENRLLPSFSAIEEEADAISEETWGRLEAAGGPDSDPGMAAQTAIDAGVMHYLAMRDAQQGLLNLFSVALYHMMEQQMVIILRQELNPKGDRKSWNLCEFVKRLIQMDIKVKDFTSWAAIRELRLVANVTKHGEGWSAQNLRQHCPEIFTPHSIKEMVDHPFLKGPQAWLFQPLAGEDLYVTIDDLQRYFDAADKFWQEFADALSVKARQDGTL